jgi:hypothetical protein
MGLDFQKAVAACFAAAVYWGARALRDGRAHFLARLLLVASQKVV